MLKWSVISRRSQDTTNAGRPQSSGIPTISNCLTPRSRTKRPHSETVRRRISLPNTKSMGCQQDKENQFTSTPIKSLEDLNLFDPFRDVSNLTPKDRIERGFVGTKINHRASLGNVQTVKNVKKDSVRKKSKKRKSFLTPFRDNVASQSPQFFKHFDRVDSHIGALPDLPNCDCDKNMNMNNLKNTRRKFPDIYAPTLPTFTIDYSPSSLKTTHCLLTLNKGERATPLTGFLETKNEIPLSKKPKIDHVNDFLHQISFLTSPEETGMIYDYNNEKNSVKMSPLVKRFVDLGFSNKRKNEFRKGINDSSFINDLSLNQIVDAILDETNDNYSNIHIENNVSKHENELNETHEENMVNADLEKKAFGPYSFDRYSLDSGFKSSTTTVNSHQLDSNFKCKCSNLNNTTIKVNETFNERCVDRSISRKRPSSEPDDSHMESKRLNVNNEVSGFSLRRQKCIRRRKSTITQASKEKIICSPIKTITQNVIKESEDHALNDVSFESSIVSESDVGKLTDVIFSNSSVVKENSSGVDTPSSNRKGRIRRCLLFDSPEAKQGRAGHHVGAGLIHLKIQQEDGELNVHVIKALNLTKTSSGPINSYVKVS
ncbi:hypothetical protein HHI36_013534 [Cryptolaemus montrouzieri]|uniref:Uncharacterized protein n=1 Tax=Cryptolaemus montrouzieri TaxID=559131 RepID=A0ABD2NIK7_9CUCU